MRGTADLAKDGLGGLLEGRTGISGSVLVISPHLDDAALSVGATIACLSNTGSTVQVVTLFAGKPVGALSGAANHFHDLCGHPYDGSAILLRRHEDRSAMEALGARCCPAGFLDAVYRTDADGAWFCQHDQAMFAEGLPDEADLVRGLTQYIAAQCDEVCPDVILTCSANGNHVDHRHAFRATLAVTRRAGIPMLAWEDLPYAVGTVTAPPFPRLTEICAVADQPSWKAKWEAISAYASQVYMLWGESDWISLLDRHAMERGAGMAAEMLWHVPSRDVNPDALSSLPRGGE
jgi:LmbE family N-acetylglucosaminyl deacetylase